MGEDGGLIAGHARVLAARQLGIVEIPVMVAAGWSEAQKRAYVLDRRVRRLRGEDLPEVFLKQIASLTITRTRCSTFGHGPGLRRQERRATVGLGQA